MTLRSRLADLAMRNKRLSPAVKGLREAKIPLWLQQTQRDDAFVHALLAATLATTSNTVDVGASGGMFVEQALRLAPEGHHVAIEPQRVAASALAQRFPSATVHSVAVSDASGTADFIVVDSQPELSGFAEPIWPHAALETRATTVPVRRLDDLVAHPVDVLKIDVEGAEIACLRGARTLLSTHRPMIIFEHGLTVPGDSADTAHGELWDLLAEFGYRIFHVHGKGPLTRADFADASASGASWNYFARV